VRERWVWRADRWAWYAMGGAMQRIVVTAVSVVVTGWSSDTHQPTYSAASAVHWLSIVE
jgi:hypothetical protein